MEPSTLHQPDVQASLPSVHVSPLARRRHERREGHPHRRRPTRRSCSWPSSTASSTSARARRARTCRRFEEVVNDAIGEVLLGESGFKAEVLAQQHRRAHPRPPGRAARRGDDRRALPRAQARARVRHPDAGDLHALRLGGGVRAAARAGSSASPRRASPRARARSSSSPARARAPAGRGLRRGADRRRSSRPCPSPRTTSAASARCTSAAPRTATTEIEAQTLLDDRRGLDVVGDLRADEALRRGRRRREGPPPPALRRGLRARDGRAASSSASATCGDGTFVSARQENLETIHQHNVVAERFGLLGELRARARDRRAPRAPHVDARVARRGRPLSAPTRRRAGRRRPARRAPGRARSARS